MGGAEGVDGERGAAAHSADDTEESAAQIGDSAQDIAPPPLADADVIHRCHIDMAWRTLNHRESRPTIVAHLQSQSVLFADGGILSFAAEGEAKYGRKHFLKLVSIFTSPPVFSVLHGRDEIGTVEECSLTGQSDRPDVLALAGRNWEVTHVDWARRKAYVRATALRGKSRWQGAWSGMSYEQAREVSALFASQDVSSFWSRRACEALAALRQDAAERETSNPTVTRNPDNGELE